MDRSLQPQPQPHANDKTAASDLSPLPPSRRPPRFSPVGPSMRLWVPGESPGGILGPCPFPTARANPSAWHIWLPTVMKVPCLCVSAALSPRNLKCMPCLCSDASSGPRVTPTPQARAHPSPSGRSAFPSHSPSAPCTGLGQVYTPARLLVMSRRAGTPVPPRAQAEGRSLEWA